MTKQTKKYNSRYYRKKGRRITKKNIQFSQFHKLTKLSCSPSAKKKNYSCLSDDAIFKLKELWNARHPDAKIESKDPKEIWAALKNYMSNVCDKETCWLKQNFVNGRLDDELEKSFAPKSPASWKKNPNEWLSSVDIMKVMKQYERAYSCFNFMGPSPIDYDTHKVNGECVWDELCHFKLQDEIKKKKFKIGVIFNLDPHYKGGSHWVSLFINIKKGQIFFYDSAGDKIPKQIMKFVNTIIEQGKQLSTPIHFEFDQNYPVEHQYGNTECGVYSLFFIVHMLEDKVTKHYLKTHIIKDKYMEQFRKIYFNEEL
jgi:hypothetical protein